MGRQFRGEPVDSKVGNYILQAKCIVILFVTLLFTITMGVYKLKKKDTLQKWGALYKDVKFEKIKPMYWSVLFLVRRVVFVVLMQI
jgi:hypothetical protein